LINRLDSKIDFIGETINRLTDLLQDQDS